MRAYVDGICIIDERRPHGLTHQEIRDICNFYPARYVDICAEKGNPSVEVYKFVKIKRGEHHGN